MLRTGTLRSQLQEKQLKLSLTSDEFHRDPVEGKAMFSPELDPGGPTCPGASSLKEGPGNPWDTQPLLPMDHRSLQPHISPLPI